MNKYVLVLEKPFDVFELMNSNKKYKYDKDKSPIVNNSVIKKDDKVLVGVLDKEIKASYLLNVEEVNSTEVILSKLLEVSSDYLLDSSFVKDMYTEINDEDYNEILKNMLGCFISTDDEENLKKEFQNWLVTDDNPDYTGKEKYAKYAYSLSRLLKIGTNLKCFNINLLSLLSLSNIDELISDYSSCNDLVNWDKKNNQNQAGIAALKKFKLFLEWKDKKTTISYWLCPANPKTYDHDGALKENGFIEWGQDLVLSKSNVGDFVYLYSSENEKRIKHRLIVVKKDIAPTDKVDDSKFWIDKSKMNEQNNYYIRLELDKTVYDDGLLLDPLQRNGLKVSALAKGFKLKDIGLINYINSFFDGVKRTTFKYVCSNKDGENKVVYGTPGCGKSYYVEHILLKDYRHDKDGLCIDSIRTTFYQDYTNTDFVGQIMPIVDGDKVDYKFIPGPFTLALDKAIKNPDHPIALVIEELNRGNAASIFGDLFQLLDRKDGTSVYNITNVNIQKYLEDVNPSLKFEFIKIPSNLSIFATMNTSDQNVYTLDTAFKRRWKFEKIKNSFDDVKLADGTILVHPYKKYNIPGIDLEWQEFCNAINNFILSSDQFINSEDKQLGVYFVDQNGLRKEKVDASSPEARKEFAYKVFEYLWDDVAKYDRKQWFGDAKSLDELIDNYVAASKYEKDVDAITKDGRTVFSKEVFKKKAE